MTTRERVDFEKWLLTGLGSMCILLLSILGYILARAQSQIDTLGLNYVDNRSRIIALESAKQNTSERLVEFAKSLEQINHKLDVIVDREIARGQSK